MKLRQLVLVTIAAAILVIAGVLIWRLRDRRADADLRPPESAQRQEEHSEPRRDHPTVAANSGLDTPTIEIHGVIVDAAGAPVAGAQVARIAADGSAAAVNWDDVAKVATDAAGRFAIGNAHATDSALVYAPGYFVRIAPLARDARIVLERARTMLLVKSRMQSIAGAHVAWRGRIENREVSGITAITDAEGRTPVPFADLDRDGAAADDVGAVRIEVTAEGFVGEKDVQVSSLPRSTEGHRELQLARSTAFDLVVENIPSGMTSVAVRVLPVTRPERVLSLVVTPSAANPKIGSIHVEGATEFKEAHVAVTSDGLCVARATIADAGAIPLTNGILRVVLGPLGAIRGRVDPPPGSSGRWSLVLAPPPSPSPVRDDPTKLSIAIGADGSFRSAALPQGVWRIGFAPACDAGFDIARMTEAYPSRSPFASMPFAHMEPSTQTAYFEHGALGVPILEGALEPFVDLHASIVVRVTLSVKRSDGTVPIGARATLRRLPRRHVLGRPDAVDLEVEFDDTGERTLMLQPGDWDFTFDAPLCTRTTIEHRTVLSVGENRVEATLARARPITVRLTTREAPNVGLSQCTLEAHAAPGSGPAVLTQDLVESATTDDRGLAVFERLANGRYVFRIVQGLAPDIGLILPGRPHAQREIEVALDEAKDGILTITLNHCSRLFGTIVTEDGLANGAIVVIKNRATGVTASLVARDDGRFDALLATPGIYDVISLKATARRDEKGVAITNHAQTPIIEGAELETGDEARRIVIRRGP